jgi:hypothetical protein
MERYFKIQLGNLRDNYVWERFPRKILSNVHILGPDGHFELTVSLFTLLILKVLGRQLGRIRFRNV